MPSRLQLAYCSPAPPPTHSALLMHLYLVSSYIYNIQRKRTASIPSKSLKLLPILGVPSLSCRPFPFNPGLRPASSAVRLGDKGPVGRWRCVPCSGSGRLGAGAVELVDESDVADCSAVSIDFLCAGSPRRLLLRFRGSPRRVALGS